jgi:hypothetical protein
MWIFLPVVAALLLLPRPSKTENSGGGGASYVDKKGRRWMVQISKTDAPVGPLGIPLGEPGVKYQACLDADTLTCVSYPTYEAMVAAIESTP